MWRVWDAPLQTGPAFVGLCRTQETTSGAAPAQLYADCNEKVIVKASASIPYSLLNARAGSCCDSHQLPVQCGKQSLHVGALHHLRLRRSSASHQCNSSAALGADIGTASHINLHNNCSPAATPQMGHRFFLKRTIETLAGSSNMYLLPITNVRMLAL